MKNLNTRGFLENVAQAAGPHTGLSAALHTVTIQHDTVQTLIPAL